MSRQNTIAIRLDQDEYVTVSAAADAESMAPSVFARSAVLKVAKAYQDNLPAVVLTTKEAGRRSLTTSEIKEMTEDTVSQMVERELSVFGRVLLIIFDRELEKAETDREKGLLVNARVRTIKELTKRGILVE